MRVLSERSEPQDLSGAPDEGASPGCPGPAGERAQYGLCAPDGSAGESKDLSGARDYCGGNAPNL